VPNNPLLPSALDIAWGVVALVVLVLTVVALVQIVRRRRALGAQSAIVFVLLVLVFPVIGAISWFVVNSVALRRQRERTS